MEPAGFTKSDLAKYPFLRETAKVFSNLDLEIAEIGSETPTILNRAEERVTLAIKELIVRQTEDDKSNKIIIKDEKAEIFSFPIAIMLVSATDNSLLKKRYALAEAKQATNEIKTEQKEKVLKIALDFNWKIALTPKGSEVPFDFVLYFADFLRNASHMRDSHWKLTNRILSDGYIYINQKDVSRLLQEEIKRRIEKRFENAKLDYYPEELSLLIDKLKILASEYLVQEELDFPKVVVQEAFPPCVKALYDGASKSHHLPHMGRFALVAFLINIGMSPESVTELFKTFSDYNERLTRYQVEHIAGERGSGTKYSCPQCSILQTHNVCKNRDELCKQIYHPLKYYKKKSDALQAKPPEKPLENQAQEKPQENQQGKQEKQAPKK
jgi:DNA primase large subunit